MYKDGDKVRYRMPGTEKLFEGQIIEDSGPRCEMARIKGCHIIRTYYRIGSIEGHYKDWEIPKFLLVCKLTYTHKLKEEN